jgi:hypothetical protein
MPQQISNTIVHLDYLLTLNNSLFTTFTTVILLDYWGFLVLFLAAASQCGLQLLRFLPTSSASPLRKPFSSRSHSHVSRSQMQAKLSTVQIVKQNEPSLLVLFLLLLMFT